jgi:hypothetical protein
MNKTACLGFPFLFISLVGFVSLKKCGKIIPLILVKTCDRGALQMVVFQHRHFFIVVKWASTGVKGDLLM